MKVYESFSEIVNDENNEISYRHPFICRLTKILKIEEEKEFIIAETTDKNKKKALSFFYKDLYKILKNKIIIQLIPFEITIFKAKCERLSEDNYKLEIYHAILDPYFGINSNILGTHNYCETKTYLSTYLNIGNETNINQLWGNIFHDFLSNVYGNRNYLLFTNNLNLYSEFISEFEKAIRNQWALIEVLNEREGNLINDFKKDNLENEINFFLQEKNKYEKEYGKFEYLCEKEINSPILGLQGRVDRLVRKRYQDSANSIQNNNSYIIDLPQMNQNQNNKKKQIQKISVIETKTGKSKQSSEIYAYYQCLSYASILEMHGSTNIDHMYIEYPLKSLKERLIEKEFDNNEILRLIKNRNEIWAIQYGLYPERGPFQNCTRCSTYDICTFHCFLHNFPDKCKNHNNKCSYYNNYNSNAKFREDFNILNEYFKFFTTLIDLEFRFIIKQKKLIHLPLKQRIIKGITLADLKYIGKTKLSGESLHTFDYVDNKNNRIEIYTNTFRKSDYVLITPYDKDPQTTETIHGIIKYITNKQLFLKINNEQDLLKNGKRYILDKDVSLLVIKKQISAIEKFTRLALDNNISSIDVLKEFLTIKLRDMSKNKKKKKKTEYKPKIPGYFNESQKRAIMVGISLLTASIIQGPPGTGKTHVIAKLAEQLVREYKFETRKIQKESAGNNKHNFNKNQIQNQTKNKIIYKGDTKKKKKSNLDHYLNSGKKIRISKPVLISTFTNKGLDNVILELIKIDKKLNIIRLGHIESVTNKKVEKYLLENYCKKEKTLNNGNKIMEIDPLLVRIVLENADIICATTTTADSIIMENLDFETVILDEAGQLTEPNSLIPLLKGKRYVIVGDHKQLPPIVRNISDILDIEIDEKNIEERETKRKMVEFIKDKFDNINWNILEKIFITKDEGLEKSLIERLSAGYKNEDNFVFLDRQYRMNKTISDFISATFYDGKLKCGIINGKSIGEQTLYDLFEEHNISTFNSTIEHKIGRYFNYDLPLIFIDSKKRKMYDRVQNNSANEEAGSRYNRGEAELIIEIVKHYFEELLKNELNFDQFTILIKSMAIISPYRAQNQLIKNLLLDMADKIKDPNNYFLKWFSNSQYYSIEDFIGKILEVDTVDRFQGQEREIIIYSCVDANKEKELRPLSIDTRRLNVAMSRAKKKVIVIGHSPTLSEINPAKYYNKKIKNAKKVYKKLIDFCKKHKSYIELEETK